MPLLCISLLALLFLPQALTCDRKKLSEDYDMLVKDEIEIAQREIINSTVNTSTCPPLKGKLRNCTSHGDEVHHISRLTDKMRNLKLNETANLVNSILSSLHIHCPKSLEKKANEHSGRTTASGHHKKGERKKLCKIKTILVCLTECYHVLSSKSQLGTTETN